MENNSFSPLFVDLDGTYTKTDLLFESVLIAIKHNPLVFFYCLVWLLKGKSYLKQQLSTYADIDCKSLPLNQEFSSFLMAEKNKGRRLYLATAANQKYAQAIVDENSLFDDYISSNENINLKGLQKLAKIKEISPVFSYAGNDAVDFEIFAHAEQSVLVNPSARAKKRARKSPVDMTFDQPTSNVKAWIKQLRIHQWLKNVLIFVPLLVSGAFHDLNSVGQCIVAFFAFSVLASATYIINDLLDLQSDRAHPRKKYRPLACAAISIQQAVVVALCLFVLAAFLGLMVSPYFSLVLLTYLSLTLFYSFHVKQYIGMDAVALALLYTIRILAGAAAISVVVSFWLLAFSIFIFLSLALVKRCSEIKSLGVEGKQRTSGRDYTTEDYAILIGFGTSSAMLAVLMFCFYINNNVLTNQYQEPSLLWLIVPALCYWLMRMWIKTHRGEMDDDPIVFSLKDKGSGITIGFCALIAMVAQL